ncbi:phage integrase family protein [Ornithinimicrobium pratense]|uniref:Phage integrase family protein n=1 Tax=Ornithinimicrobium pratense TaxID=2593973 RepID=A0A5J6VAP0_9MICO|nr:phage integrase family protein [Ornithinimicrobium pratense]
MINAGVPQHVVQKMLRHASPQMTARYATIHDATVPAAFDGYQQRRVDIEVHNVPFAPDAPGRGRVDPAQPRPRSGHPAQRVLRRPPQQECPHLNTCLTCPTSDHPNLLAHPPPPARRHPRTHRPGQGARQRPLGRQPPQGRRPPRPDHHRLGNR